jgi:ketosteroid isomerase-like protein
MSQPSTQEERNLALVHQWQELYNTPGMVDRIIDTLYADECEVLAPLYRMYFVKRGQSKELWRSFEREVEKGLQSRKMEITSIVAQGDQVALEAVVRMKSKDGKRFKSAISAFLTFENSRIVTDHTYMSIRNIPPPSESVKKIFDQIMQS